MAFKTIKQYNQERYDGMFLLRDDGDYADVIFMYRSIDDVLQADTHYIKSAEYSGYVHCCGVGCPACAKNIRVQSKLFIPMYRIEANEVQFFDRNARFEQQLTRDVLSKYSNPSEYVFRITRHGAAGDTDTYYDIHAIAKNTVLSYDQICAKLNITLPNYYSRICKEFSVAELERQLSASAPSESTNNISMPEYKITPRASIGVEPVTAETAPEAPVEPSPEFTALAECDTISDDYADVEDVDF